MDVPDDLVFNAMIEFCKKKEIDVKVRAKLMKNYRQIHNISQRELGRQLGVPHSTIADHESYDNVPDEEIEDMKEAGLTDTQIYRTTRKTRGDRANNKSKVEIELKKISYLIEQLYKYVTLNKVGMDTEYMVKDLKRLINDMIDKFEK